jgi:hypothetical protein
MILINDAPLAAPHTPRFNALKKHRSGRIA